MTAEFHQAGPKCVGSVETGTRSPFRCSCGAMHDRSAVVVRAGTFSELRQSCQASSRERSSAHVRFSRRLRAGSYILCRLRSHSNWNDSNESAGQRRRVALRGVAARISLQSAELKATHSTRLLLKVSYQGAYQARRRAGSLICCSSFC